MRIKTMATLVTLQFAALGASAASQFEVTGALNNKTLTLQLKETEAVGPACDLYVQKFEYFPDFKFIVLKVNSVKNCPLDSIAPRKADVMWKVPFNFSAQKSIFLKVNNRTVGTLEIQDQSVTFKPRGN